MLLFWFLFKLFHLFIIHNIFIIFILNNFRNNRNNLNNSNNTTLLNILYNRNGILLIYIVFNTNIINILFILLQLNIICMNNILHNIKWLTYLYSVVYSSSISNRLICLYSSCRSSSMSSISRHSLNRLCKLFVFFHVCLSFISARTYSTAISG